MISYRLGNLMSSTKKMKNNTIKWKNTLTYLFPLIGWLKKRVELERLENVFVRIPELLYGHAPIGKSTETEGLAALYPDFP